MDPIHHLKRPQLYENECRWHVGTLYQCTICIYMYKHTDGMLQKTHPKCSSRKAIGLIKTESSVLNSVIYKFRLSSKSSHMFISNLINHYSL